MSKTLEWYSDKCGHVEPVDPEDYADYEPGDDEPCVHCPHKDCVATVRRIEGPQAKGAGR